MRTPTTHVAGTAVLLAVLTPGPGAAQSSGDLARYREVTASEVVLRTPQGPITVTTDHDAVLAVEYVTPDSMEAWYETLTVSSESPMGRDEPETAGVLGERFVLRYGADGRVETLAHPDVPEQLAQLTDLRLQFEDFFPVRPADALRPGLAWTDTIVSSQVDGERRSTSTSIIDYVVVGDSVAGGERLVVVSGDATISIEGEGPVPDQPGVSVHSVMEGTEVNTFLLLPSGRMWSRTRSATLTGTMAYRGFNQPVSLDVTRTYENAITTR